MRKSPFGKRKRTSNQPTPSDRGKPRSGIDVSLPDLIHTRLHLITPDYPVIDAPFRGIPKHHGHLVLRLALMLVLRRKTDQLLNQQDCSISRIPSAMRVTPRSAMTHR
jgi:hypothetical protein